MVARTGFVPVDVWPIESLRYVDDGQPMVGPDWVQAIEDEPLHESLLAFAASKNITVSEMGLHGARGVSMVGEIGLQRGDHWSAQVAPLIHELAHELLHDIHARLQPGTRSLHEHEAEAAVVLRYAGHPTSTSAACLRQWGASPKDVIASRQRVTDAAGQIVEFVEGWKGGAEGAAVEAAPSEPIAAVA